CSDRESPEADTGAPPDRRRIAPVHGPRLDCLGLEPYVALAPIDFRLDNARGQPQLMCRFMSEPRWRPSRRILRPPCRPPVESRPPCVCVRPGAGGPTDPPT